MERFGTLTSEENEQTSIMPEISIIIPALNEADSIGSVVNHIKLLPDYAPVGNKHGVEIIVVDGDPDGSTLEALRKNDAMGITSSKGRGRQMNVGAAAATGDTLVFLHADTRLPQNALSKLRKARACGIEAGAFSLSIASERPAFRAIAAGARFRTRMTGIPYGDQAQFFSRELFEQLDGYAEIPLMEDVEIMRRVRASGVFPVVLSERVKTSSRRWERDGAFYGTVRNTILVHLYSLGVSPAWLARFYR